TTSTPCAPTWSTRSMRSATGWAASCSGWGADVGHLDEAAFRDVLAACVGCGGGKHELRAIIDQAQPVMYGDADGAPRWVHDGEKFVDGTYRIACVGCGR